MQCVPLGMYLALPSAQIFPDGLTFTVMIVPRLIIPTTVSRKTPSRMRTKMACLPRRHAARAAAANEKRFHLHCLVGGDLKNNYLFAFTPGGTITLTVTQCVDS